MTVNQNGTKRPITSAILTLISSQHIVRKTHGGVRVQRSWVKGQHAMSFSESATNNHSCMYTFNDKVSRALNLSRWVGRLHREFPRIVCKNLLNIEGAWAIRWRLNPHVRWAFDFLALAEPFDFWPRAARYFTVKSGRVSLQNLNMGDLLYKLWGHSGRFNFFNWKNTHESKEKSVRRMQKLSKFVLFSLGVMLFIVVVVVGGSCVLKQLKPKYLYFLLHFCIWFCICIWFGEN